MYYDPGICKIYDNVYLSNRLYATYEVDLKRLKIGTVISILSSETRSNDEIKKYHRLRIRNYHFQLEDDTNAPIHTLFKQCAHIITHRSNPYLGKPGVLVHCAAGISRSATILIAYGMMKFNWTLSKAFMHVWTYRKIISPNEGFWEQLKHLDLEMRLTRLRIYDDSSNDEDDVPL